MDHPTELQIKDNPIVAQRIERLNQWLLQKLQVNIVFNPDGHGAIFKTFDQNTALNVQLLNIFIKDLQSQAQYENGRPVYTIRIVDITKHSEAEFNELFLLLETSVVTLLKFDKLPKFSKQYAYGTLKHFNWVAHHFVSEGLNSDSQFQYPDFIHTQKQIEEFAQACLYAEREIIPYLQKNGFDQLTPELLQSWIKKIHAIAAKTLADTESANPAEIRAGEYSTEGFTMRWVKSVGFRDALVRCTEDETALKKLFIEHELGDIFESFLHIRSKVNQARTRITKESIDFLRSQPFFEGHLFIELLEKIYREGVFSAAEKQIIAKIVKICMPHEQMPAAMQQFTSQLIDMLKQCKGQVDEVARIMAFIFYQITEIHAFFNGNGRDATIFSNIFAIIFAFLAVVYRTAEEKNNPQSIYSKAIANISYDRALLEELILKQLNMPPQSMSVTDQITERSKLQLIQLAYQLDEIARRRLLVSVELELVFKYESSRILTHDDFTTQLAAQSAQQGLPAFIPWQHFKPAVEAVDPKIKYAQLKQQAMDLFTAEKFPKALELYNECLKLAQQRDGAQSEEIATLHYNIGSCHDRMGDLAQAIEQTKHCLSMREKLPNVTQKDRDRAELKIKTLTSKLSPQAKTP